MKVIRFKSNLHTCSIGHSLNANQNCSVLIIAYRVVCRIGFTVLTKVFVFPTVPRYHILFLKLLFLRLSQRTLFVHAFGELLCSFKFGPAITN